MMSRETSARSRTPSRARREKPSVSDGDPTTDVAIFAERVLRLPLWAHQLVIARSKRFIRVVAAARRTGKSEYAEVEAIWTAFRERNVTVIILSATQEAARRLTESIGARLAANPLTSGAVVDDFATRIRLDNGSQIISLPASQRQVRGYGKGVRLVVLDEAGFMPDELWTAAHYTALDERPHSRILILGTPWGSGFFRAAFNAGLDGDPDYESFNWRYDANPKLDHAYLERQRDKVSPAEYAAEVLGEWSDAAGALFTRELLDANTADIAIPPLASLRGAALGIVAVDWGVSFDRSAAVAIFRLPVAALNPDRERVPTFLALPYTWPQKEPLHNVVDAVVRALPSFRYVASETNGIGAMPSTELQRRGAQMRKGGRDATPHSWAFVNTTAATKTTGYAALLGLLERRQLVLPRDPSLLRQLHGLRFEQRTRGFHIEAEDAATHDDVADALYLATLPHRPEGAKRVVCHLAALAASRRVAADARTPDLDCPVVETGDGLRIHSRPTLQGVVEPAISLYATPVAAEPVGIRTPTLFIHTDRKVS